jgi:hypothetical protein
MKNRNPLILLLLAAILLLGCNENVFARLYSDTNKVTQVQNKLSISAGVGVSYGFTGISSPNTFSSVTESSDQYYIYNREYNCSLEYRFTHQFGLALAMGYQSGALYVVGNPFDYMTNLNIAVRTLFYLNKKNIYFDHYIGIRAGCSYWHDTKVPPNNYPLVLGNPNLYTPSFQVSYGISLYPSGGILGFNFEVGIGAPYIIQGGIICRM